MAQFINWGTGREGSLNISAANLGGIGGFGVATVTGTAGQTSCVKTDCGYFNGGNGGRDGDMVFIHQSQGTGAGQWEVNYIVSTSGTTVNLLYPLAYTYGTGAQMYTSPQLYNGTISGNLVPYSAWDGSSGGIVFLVDKGTLTVSGSISVSGSGFRGGSQRQDYAYTGEGYPGASYLMSADYQNNGNGGSGGHHASPPDNIAVCGSGGGNGTQGESAYYSSGGSAVGNTSLTSMFLGGGGGGGSKGNNNGGTGGNGAAGAGIIVLIAKTIVVSGSLLAVGTVGQYGPDSSWGGSGAGGSILIKAQSATLGNSINASGGARPDPSGKAGGAGRIHIDYYSGYTGTTTPTIDAAQDTNLKSDVYCGMI